MKLFAALLLAGLGSLDSPAQDRELFIKFEPGSEAFATAAAEYRAIWAHHGKSIVAAMEAVSGLKFEDREIRAIILEVSSDSGYGEKPMHLRASYPPDTKKATLIHELGHRLQADMFSRGEDDHKYLFLWICDVWVRLYGQEFADAQVSVERQRGRMYPADWDYVLSMNADQRAAKWKELVATHQAH